MPKVEGTELLSLPRAEVWRLLNEPDTLAASIPGCRGFDRDADAAHRYLTAIKVAVGPVTGVYEGTVEYLDVAEPERCTIVVSGKGDKGSIDGRGAITLSESGEGTEVGYVGDFKLTGPVAGVGQRMAPGVSRKMIVETLRNLERHGESPRPEPDAAAEPGAAPPESGPAPATSADGSRAAGAPAPSAGEFRPLSISPMAAFAAGCALGLLIGARYL
jgi:carbon monoxide dehydrogenase subunit G